ncbi:hypothetical protein SLEP1_g3911 [Rubroshorea leprosula]|uniref:Uncharacterized protein n=1 Tax=Rubroshorea leprosula TaxID=152421 RepID=A0AAV5HV59_9ROSI|nr:hypothetical protein SLEP1_g3911 [Rubroshorea leprosula]
MHVGWGHHMICNKKYHSMLPSKDTVAAFFNCDANCIDPNHPSKEELSLVELQGHVMHGVFHCNGFGHLLCINGVETGSDLAGHQIMDFWDRLCTGLRDRKVSLCDVSKKRGMELRLLHGLANGKSWFCRWGYEFGRGCYGVTQPETKMGLNGVVKKGMGLGEMAFKKEGGVINRFPGHMAAATRAIRQRLKVSDLVIEVRDA